LPRIEGTAVPSSYGLIVTATAQRSRQGVGGKEAQVCYLGRGVSLQAAYGHFPIPDAGLIHE
jgi:hypothetical protein